VVQRASIREQPVDDPQRPVAALREIVVVGRDDERFLRRSVRRTIISQHGEDGEFHRISRRKAGLDHSLVICVVLPVVWVGARCMPFVREFPHELPGVG